MTLLGFQSLDSRRGWGRTARGLERVAKPRFQEDVIAAASQALDAGYSLLAGGLGRSYGDSSLNLGGAVLDMTGLDRVLSFDRETGRFRAEAGLSLGETLARTLPHGWFLPTTPGTRFVTLGGAVANDIHGKNHHRAGSIGCAVRAIGLWRSDLGLAILTPEEHPELFAATIGALGLTGAILWVELQLVRVGSAYLDQEVVAFDRLEEFFALAQASEAAFEHTVAWIDCTAKGDALGRGLFNRANWRNDGRMLVHSQAQRATLPIDMPGLALNPLTLKAFNAFYYRHGRAKSGAATTDYASALYPLDAIGGWNRFYGARGFYQYQCAAPMAKAPEALQALLSQIASSGQGSFLAVLKTFGERISPGLLTFPMHGATLALDFPNLGPKTHALFDALDAIVLEAGGRLYPAKDGRMSPTMFRRGYPMIDRFDALRDPRFSSSFWRRSFHG